MLKVLLFLVLLFSAGVLSAEEPMRVATWEKVVGWKHPDIDLYIDLSTVKHHITNDSHESYGMLLFRRHKSVTVDITGGPLLTNSFARYYVVDCKNNLYAVLADFYFNTQSLPKVSDVPARAFDYSDNKDIDVSNMPKTDLMYKIFCPDYI